MNSFYLSEHFLTNCAVIRMPLRNSPKFNHMTCFTKVNFYKIRIFVCKVNHILSFFRHFLVEHFIYFMRFVHAILEIFENTKICKHLKSVLCHLKGSAWTLPSVVTKLCKCLNYFMSLLFWNRLNMMDNSFKGMT